MYESPGARLCLGLRSEAASGTRLFLGLSISGVKLGLGLRTLVVSVRSMLSRESSDMSGMMLCRGLRLISGASMLREARSLSTGDTAMLARRPGLVAADRQGRVCGEDAALREARRRLDDVLLCNISASVRHGVGHTWRFPARSGTLTLISN